MDLAGEDMTKKADVGSNRPAAGRVRATIVTVLAAYLGSAITIVKGIVFLPLYLRTLGVDVYGAFLASANVVGMLGVVDFGLNSVLFQRLSAAWGAKDEGAFRRLTGAALVIVPALVTILVVASLSLAKYVPEFVRAPESIRSALVTTFVLTALGAGGSLAIVNLVAVVSAWQRTEIAAAVRLSGQIVEMIAIAAGLAGGLGVVALGLAAFIGSWVGLTVGITWTVIAWRKMNVGAPQLSRPVIMDLARTVAPMTASRIVLQVGSNAEVLLISRIVGPSMAAIYSITERIVRVATTFVSPIAGSVLSSLSHFVGERGVSAARRPIEELFAFWSLVAAVVWPSLLATNSDFTSLWVGRENYGGVALNATLCLAALLSARSFMASIVLTSLGSIAAVAWISVLEVVIRLPLLYLGLVGVGLVGMPAASAAASILSLFTYSYFINRDLQLRRWNRWRFQSTGFLAITACFLGGIVEAMTLPTAGTWPLLILKAAIACGCHSSLAILLNRHGLTVAMMVHRRKRGTVK